MVGGLTVLLYIYDTVYCIYIIYNYFPEIIMSTSYQQQQSSESSGNLVLQNMQLSYNPALQSHQKPQNHYATPAQVTRPQLTLAVPQQQSKLDCLLM